MLTVADVAAITQLDPQAIRRAISRRELSAVKLCGRLRIEPSAFEAWRDANRVRGRDATHRENQSGRRSHGLKGLLDK
jgi:hypothetical protein